MAIKSAGGNGGRGPAPSAGRLSLPSRRTTPLAAVTKRMLLAAGLLVLSDGSAEAVAEANAAGLAAVGGDGTRIEEGDQLIVVSSHERRTSRP